MTRRDKNGLYGSKGEGFKKRDMLKRREIILASGADLVISIHLNKFLSTSRKGAQAFFREGSELGKLAAAKIQEQLNKNINLHRSFEALKGDYYLLNCSDIPSVIVECGFLSNPEEEKLLATAEYQDKLAYIIFAGAISYFCSNSKLDVNL
jgi:N-acetylmuramoyl-L-alanine amidase